MKEVKYCFSKQIICFVLEKGISLVYGFEKGSLMAMNLIDPKVKIEVYFERVIFFF